MRITCHLFAAALALGVMTKANAEHKLETTKGAPDGLSKKVAGELDPTAYRVKGKDGPVVEIWLAKSVDVKPDFKPTLSIKYPFKPGQLLGALRIPKGVKYTDFRGQEMKPGAYTLRYGQQPQDGNHIGTSALSDFLLALPAKMDTDPKTINIVDKLHQQSAKAVGSTHPAIFSLLPAKKTEKAKLEHNADKEFVILNATVTGSAKGKKTSVPLRMVAIGKSAE